MGESVTIIYDRLFLNVHKLFLNMVDDLDYKNSYYHQLPEYLMLDDKMFPF